MSKHKKSPLTPERMTVLTAEGRFALTYHNWYLGLRAEEWSEVYGIRAHAQHWACRREQRRRDEAAVIANRAQARDFPNAE